MIEGAPLSGFVSSGFGPRDPIWTPAGWTDNFHSGVDIVADYGTPIKCPAPGVVTFSGFDSVGAQIVTVKFEDSTGAIFVHMAGPMAGRGKVLARGEFLGQVGSTGMSTGPHLHYMRIRRVVEGTAFWYANEDLIDPFSPEGGHVETISIVSPITVNVCGGTWPPYSGAGAYLPVLANCSAQQVVAEAQAEAGIQLASIWVYTGVWKSYIVGAPAAVNAAFPPLTAGSAIYVVRK